MDKVNDFCDWFLKTYDKVSHFFDGFGLLLGSLLVVLAAAALFYLLVPKWYQMAIKIDVVFVLVNYIATWLQTKL